MKIKSIIATTGLVTAGIVVPCQAVLVDINPGSSDWPSISNFSAPPALAAVWNNVGAFSDASGVYLGNGWMLTAYHVQLLAPGNVLLGGQNYTWDGNPATRITNPSDGTPTDLQLFRLTTIPNLPALSLATSSPAVGTPYYNVGYGNLRDTGTQYYDGNWTITTAASAVYTGFGFSVNSNTNQETWGNNTVMNISAAYGPGNGTNTTIVSAGIGNLTAFAGEFEPGTDQVVYGDSGGPVFNAAGQLIGINNYNDVDPRLDANPQPWPFYGATYGEISWMADIATYASEIDSITGVPEPGSFSLIAMGIFALTTRNTRSARRARRQV